jgi:FkbM family methyltransferase
MEHVQIKLRGMELRFSRENDIYPTAYYHSVANDEWEPMTVAFFERNLNQNTVLIDVGAATGILSMFAAKLGSDVIAFEPNPVAMSVLKTNIEINYLQEKISAIPDAVSDSNSVMKFSVGSNSNVLSPIVMHGIQNHSNTEIRVRNIVEVVNDCLQNSNKELVIKMDIEGGEYQILCNRHAVNEVGKKISKMFISFHPGFNRPSKLRNKYIVYLAAKLKYPWVLRDHYKIFDNLTKDGKLMTPDGKTVVKSSVFIGLLHFGSLDWVWIPTKKRHEQS